jgi:hypothetical protein
MGLEGSQSVQGQLRLPEPEDKRMTTFAQINSFQDLEDFVSVSQE